MFAYVDAMSSVDWDGRIVSTVFMRGCPFRCWYCHNRDLLFAGENMSIDEVKKRIDIAANFIDGVCITGGEPLMNFNDLYELVKFLNDSGIDVKLDTNGYYPGRLSKVVDYVDYVAMDVKEVFDDYSNIMDDGRKIDGSRMRSSVDIIMGSGCEYEFRTTVLDTSKKWIKDVASQVIGADKYVLQMLRLGNIYLYDVSDLYFLKEELEIEGWFKEVKVR